MATRRERENSGRSAIGWALLGVGLAAIGLLTVWLIFGRMAAEKIGTALVLPTGLLGMLLVAASVWILLSRERRAGAVMLVLTGCYWLMGSATVADNLARSLEAPFVGINPLETVQPYDAIVLLGGGGGRGANGRLQGNQSGDRMILAAQMYHQGLTRQIVCTGQRIESLSPNGTDPSVTSHDVLTRLGVPDSAIAAVGGRNTTEEMDNLQKRYSDGAARVGLVTSAWHLPRALRLANRRRFFPDPLPADFWSGFRGTEPPAAARVIESLIPSAQAMMINWYCCKEYLGMLVGR